MKQNKETLVGKDLLDRVRGMMNINESVSNKPQDKLFVLTKIGADNKVYGIVKESGKFFIKVSKTRKALTESVNHSEFDYMGGMAHRGRYMTESYADATKLLSNLLFNLATMFGGEQTSPLNTNDFEVDYSDMHDEDEIDFEVEDDNADDMLFQDDEDEIDFDSDEVMVDDEAGDVFSNYEDEAMTSLDKLDDMLSETLKKKN